MTEAERRAIFRVVIAAARAGSAERVVRAASLLGELRADEHARLRSVARGAVSAGAWTLVRALVGLLDPDGERERRAARKEWRRQQRSIARRLRAAVIARDGYVCHLCAGPVDPGRAHVDHVTPISRGGPSTMENLRVAHPFCNLSKGGRLQ